jgi:phosphoribosylformylglycinamidine cyclo-ligase
VTKKSSTSSSKKKPSKSAARKKSSKSPKPDDTSAPAYASAGVDLDHDEGFISEIAEITRPTMRPEILSSIGGFAGLFKAPDRYKDPVFVAGADGVGTKLKLAAELGRYDTVGIDCVAMVVNDLVVQGAEPIVFLDYMAMNQLDPDTAKEALRGMAEGCRRAGCALLGGETATMPGVYSDGEIELVGFGVGVVERDQIVDGSGISHGDVILGIASSGFHSNGYSLVRKVVEAGIKDGQLEMRAENPELNTSLAAALMTPTRIYVKPILNLVRDFNVKGIAHITGGGFEGNLPRVLPNAVQAQIDPKSWPRPPIFDLLQRVGGISDEEMLRVFNCGIGMVAIVPPEQTDEILDRLSALSERAYRIGTVEAKGADEPTLVFGPRAAAGD